MLIPELCWKIHSRVFRKGVFALAGLIWIVWAGFLPVDSVQAEEKSQVVRQNHSLHSSFQDFAHSRIKLLNRNYLHTPDNMDLKPQGSCFVASYSRVEQDSIQIAVKETGSRETRFIGILSYTESVYESKKHCGREEVKGPFNPVSRRRITEIFRYAGQSWQ